MNFYEKQTKQFCNNNIDLYNVDVHRKNKVRTVLFYVILYIIHSIQNLPHIWYVTFNNGYKMSYETCMPVRIYAFII